MTMMMMMVMAAAGRQGRRRIALLLLIAALAGCGLAEDALEATAAPTGCLEDAKFCPDTKTSVERDPKLDCDFPACPAPPTATPGPTSALRAAVEAQVQQCKHKKGPAPAS